MTKPCGECKECCRGPLKLEVKGCFVGKGKPCPHVDILADKGCTIYDERPKVCVDYECWWKMNDDFPDFMRPDKSNIIITDRHLKGIMYLDVMATAGNKISYESISHILKYAVLKGKNIVWRHNDYEEGVKMFWLGSPEFMKIAYEDQFSLSQSSKDL